MFSDREPVIKKRAEGLIWENRQLIPRRYKYVLCAWCPTLATMIVILISVVFASLGISSASDLTRQVKADSCDSFNHPQYGFGQCIDQNQCPNGLFQSGLCESKPTNIKCCFSVAAPKEEFRAVWLATVANIDWPASRTATPAQQQTELINILNTVQRLNMNAIIFQVDRRTRDRFVLIPRPLLCP